MATDVARLSFDPARYYRGVVPQQGRVTLEADQNEQRTIDNEERRAEIIDIVGPYGTPDDGYAVSQSGGTVQVGAGTMYLGGWRVELDELVLESDQPDWLDHSAPLRPRGNEAVWLLLRETDVTAVEDPALYEVALGGPDTAARMRLLQRIKRLSTSGDTCAEATKDLMDGAAKAGLELDLDDLQLRSQSRMQVTWEGDPQPADPCEPTSTGGYLGAENQLIRVQIVAQHDDGTFDFLWGWDDASFLYRVTPDDSTEPVLTLDRTPVDDYHRPRAGQPVQVLRATAELASTDDVVEGWVAALGGEVGVLTTPYDPDTKSVQFPAPLPAVYLDTDETPQLYLRVWEELVTGAELSDAISLEGTGVAITITSDGPSQQLPVDDYWCIGVRPSTPTAVYPARYLRTPQPPEGPRQWMAPLAVIQWTQEEMVIVEDCRRPFDPLVDFDTEGCCTLDVTPSDAGQLQELIDGAAAGRDLQHRTSHITICLAPGHYELREPLVLRERHSNLTLRGCSKGAVIEAHPDAVANFRNGLLLLLDVNNVTLEGIELVLPQVPPGIRRVGSATGGMFTRAVTATMNSLLDGRWSSIGVRAVNCAVLKVDDCLFRFSLGEQESTPEDVATMPRNIFGVGLYLSGGSWGLRVESSRFLHHGSEQEDDERVTRLLAGILVLPVAVGRDPERPESRALGGARLPALIEDAEIVDNHFDGLTVAIAINSAIGWLRITDNSVQACNSGILIRDLFAAIDFMEAVQPGRTHPIVESVGRAVEAALRSPAMAEMFVMGATIPLPTVEGFTPSGVEVLDPEDLRDLRDAARESYANALADAVAALEAEHPASEEGERDAEAVAGEPLVADRSLLRAVVAIEELARVNAREIEFPAAVRIEQNVVDCSVPVDGSTGSALMLVLNPRDRDSATATITSNRLASPNPPRATALATGLVAATLTGNIIAAGDKRSHSLILANAGVVAVTGNVLLGPAVLPANRPFPAPLDTWLPLNTVE